jgi:transcriptional regulator of aromatic amino acid metabolism
MARKLTLGILMLVCLCNTGCLINQYSSDPAIRTEQLLVQSEDMRQMKEEWRRFWFNDHPSTLTPNRITGTIAP